MPYHKPVTDEDIRDAVRSIAARVPPDLDERVERALALRNRSRRFTRAGGLGIGAALAASILLAVLALTGPWFQREAEPAPVSLGAIETRMQIPGKKITIVWTQREGFSLPSSRGVNP